MSFGYQVLGFGSGAGVASYSVEMLIVAGGGGSVSHVQGGAGAGGYRTPTSDLVLGTDYTVTVGGGGAGGTGAPGNPGGVSSIAGADITTVTSAGGGWSGTKP